MRRSGNVRSTRKRRRGRDANSNQTDEQLQTYKAYSIDGDGTGDLV